MYELTVKINNDQRTFHRRRISAILKALLDLIEQYPNQIELVSYSPAVGAVVTNPAAGYEHDTERITVSVLDPDDGHEVWSEEIDASQVNAFKADVKRNPKKGLVVTIK